MNKTMASARTLVTNLLTRCNTDNLVAELELFQDDFQSLRVYETLQVMDFKLPFSLIVLPDSIGCLISWF